MKETISNDEQINFLLDDDDCDYDFDDDEGCFFCGIVNCYGGCQDDDY